MSFPGGVLVAADRRVTFEEEGGAATVRSARKLFPLGARAALATSGAAVGIAISRRLSRLLEGRPPLPLPDLADWVVCAFQKRYDEFTARGEEWFARHPLAHRLSYVLIAGANADGSAGFRLAGSEGPDEPYRTIPTGQVLAAPRRLGLETRLARLLHAAPASEEVARTVLEGLRLIASREGSVAGPFDLAVFGPGGDRFESVEE